MKVLKAILKWIWSSMARDLGIKVWEALAGMAIFLWGKTLIGLFVSADKVGLVFALVIAVVLIIILIKYINRKGWDS